MTSPADFAAHLNALHASGLSWQTIREQFYPTVARGTLCRIAKSGGAYMPKDRKILKVLGLGQGRRSRTAMEKAIAKMARETRKAVMVKK